MIITDTTPLSQIDAGLKGRDPACASHGCYAAVTVPPNDALLIPQSEWQARIEERKKLGTGLKSLIDRAGLQVLDQQQTNYCWVNGPTYAAMVARLVQHQDVVRLSPASVGAPVKGYRNDGGWGSEAIKYGHEHGWVPQSLWPANAIDRRYDTAETQTLRQYYRVTEWQLLREAYGDTKVSDQLALQRLVSYLLRNVPVPVGFNWWSHEVCAVDVDWVSGAPALVIANSWGPTWGTQGFGTIQGQRMIPDDAVAPQVMASS